MGARGESGSQAGGGDEGERTSGSSPLGMYFGFWKTRLLTIESGLPGEGQASASASGSAVTATEARAEAGPRAESGGEWGRGLHAGAACRRRSTR